MFKNALIRVQHPHWLILARPSGLKQPRLGLVIAKKHIRLAVQRNCAKRLIRETFRHKQHQLPAIDAIVLARRGSGNFNKRELTDLLNRLWQSVARKALRLTKPGPQT